MTRLEQRYRRVLRLLPAAYRRAWQDDMVAAFLESMADDSPVADETGESDNRWPSFAEVVSVGSLAVRLRFGGPGAKPAAFALGNAVRLACLLGVLTNAVMISSSVLASGWLAHHLPAEVDRVGSWPFAAPGTWHTGWDLLGCGWPAAYLALVLGRRRAAQILALVAVLPETVTPVSRFVAGDLPLTIVALAYLGIDVLLILAMTAFPDGEPLHRRRGWLLAVPLGVVSVCLPMVLIQAALPAARMIDWPGVVCVLIAAAALFRAAGQRRQRVEQSLEAGLALTLLAMLALAFRVVTLLGCLGQVDQTGLLLIGGAELVAVLAITVPLANATFGRLRQLEV